MVEVTCVYRGRTGLRVEQRTRAGTAEVDVTGLIRAGEGLWELKRRIDDPARMAAELFR
jgi:hypothetical protein